MKAATIIRAGLAMAGLVGAAFLAACGSDLQPPGLVSATSVTDAQRTGAELFIDFACVRCHAPDGTDGIPNRLNVGGDDTIPPLNNVYRDPSEQFTDASQITSVVMEGSIISRSPGVINMPCWKGVINAAQASAIADYVLAGLPHTGVRLDLDVSGAAAIYEAYACIRCHGQVGQPGAPNPLSPDKSVPELRNPNDNVTQKEMRATIMDGSIPPPGVPGEIFMPAWGQILAVQQVDAILPYIPDGPEARPLPSPPPVTPLPLASP
jgi:mono/diheme cytochrome c family protein